jgi:hypothetical protein
MCEQSSYATQHARMRELAAELGPEAVAWAEQKIAGNLTCNQALHCIAKLGGKAAKKRGIDG